MILLVTKSPRSQDCADAIAHATSESVKIAATPRQASVTLDQHDFRTLVIDQQMQESDPGEMEQLLLRLGTAMPVFVNLAINGTERVIREIGAAMRRREKERLIADEGAQQKLRNELKDTVTALLLSCEMALQTPALFPSAQARLHEIESLVLDLGRKIGFKRRGNTAGAGDSVAREQPE